MSKARARRDSHPGEERGTIGEPAAVLFTGAAYILAEALAVPPAGFMALAGAAWGTYAVLRLRRDPGVARQWGLRIDGIARASMAPAAVLLAGAAGLAAAGASLGRLTLSSHLLPCLLVYPVWGLAQQWLVQAMLARNLRRWIRARWTSVAAALFFSLLHAPDPALMACTLALGGVLTSLYLRRRHLLPLGVVHGWLGALAYAWLLGRDPWAEVFGP